MIVGIDPGLKGGLTALGSDGSIMFIFELDRGLRWLLECCAVGNLIPSHVFVEKAQSMPKQGISSAFNYGVGFGEILGILKALRLPHTLVPPRTWTKVMHAGTKDRQGKARSFEAAGRLFPDQNWVKSKDGRYESALIAEYGRRVLNIPAKNLARAQSALVEAEKASRIDATKLEAAEDIPW